MEKRQLDFNAPLMSARRYSSPSKSSELVKKKVLETPHPSRQQPIKSYHESELTKPASVPFHWEHIPGRPKGEPGSHSHTPARLSSGEFPKLPPGRLSGPSRYCSGERSNDQNMFKPQVESFSLTDHASLLEKLNDSLNCRDESDSESGDDTYSDALDTLSQTESWSFNYSVSGISGCLSSDIKPSGTFCIDTQTRDFMMNRFLPAAKAVILETPEYSVKKSSVLQEKPSNEVKKKAVSCEMKPPLRQYSGDALPYYAKFVDNVESEDEYQESIAPKKKLGKKWGFLPKFCVKNSLCLLNPLPALKLKPKSRPPSPSTHEVRRLTRNAHSGPLDKNACQVVTKKKFHSGLLTGDLPRIDDKFASDTQRLAGASPLRRYSNRSGNISPYRNESPKSPFREGAGFLGLPKESETFNAKIASSRKMFKALQDVSRNQVNERGLNPKLSPDSGPIGKVDVKEGGVMDVIVKSPLAPPLPKSPSESWLWRTLPSIGNPFANSRSSSPLRQKKGQKVSADNAKWETIVKTSNIRPDNVRYSEELHRASYRSVKS